MPTLCRARPMAITSGSFADVGIVFPYVNDKMKEAANLETLQYPGSHAKRRKVFTS